MSKNTSVNSTPIKSGPTMEELLASRYARSKLLTLFRGQQVEGEIVAITDKEITLDLGAKSEGVLPKKELDEQIKDLTLGSRLTVFVAQSENESGQAVLSASRHFEATSLGGQGRKARFQSGKAVYWNKFIQAHSQKNKMRGTVLEINKGGLIVEVEGVRGFLPNSQVGFELLSKSGQGLDKLVGQTLSLSVIEVDQNNNKLIFTQRGQVSEDIKTTLKDFKINQKVSGKIVAVLPFGLVVSVKDQSSSGRDDLGVEGLVFISDVDWEKVEDLPKRFSVGQELAVVVIGIDESLGRLSLSIKQLTEDPFAKLADRYPPDESVKAEVVSVSDAGVVFRLEDPASEGTSKVEGFLPSSKMAASTVYEPGKKMTVLVDNVDVNRRRINLAPFITSTEGLIYK